VDTMPGGPELASQLGVGRMTIEAALSMLESEGLLVFYKLKSPDFVALTLGLLTFDSGRR
jgi:DNA-binding FadR family transcriptional regulator